MGWEKASEKGFESWRRSSDTLDCGWSASIAKRSTAGMDVAWEDTVVEEEELLRNGLFAAGGDTFACSEIDFFVDKNYLFENININIFTLNNLCN